MSFLRLNEMEGKFMVVSYGPVRRSPVLDELWEIGCGIVDVTKLDDPFEPIG